MSDAYYVTTPIYYVNADLHIGGAYTTLAADVLARYNRLKGKETMFLTGSDEHGQKIEQAAREQGISPKELADRIVAGFKEVWEFLEITNDDFIRTTDPRHEATVQAFFKLLIDKGDIYKGVYSGLYCVPCERYLKQSDLVEGNCPVCRRQPSTLDEENYFFRMSAYQDAIRRHYEENPDFVEPQSRRNEVLSRIRMGLEDVSVSRSTFTWGVPMPGDSKHIVWVWFDALINYISALGWPEDREKFDTFWPQAVHLVGKDIIWFHCVIWPCMLLAAGLTPPKKIFAHGWWTIDGKKISKSAGTVVYPRDVVEKYGLDQFRYFMLREIPFGADGDFSFKALTGRINSDLADDLGNLLSRTLAMVSKYFNNSVPEPADEAGAELREMASGLLAAIDAELEHLAFSRALDRIWELIRRCNKFIEDEKPWLLKKKGDTAKLGGVLYVLLESLRIVSWAIEPVMPASALEIRRQLGIPDEKGVLSELMTWGHLKPGTSINRGDSLFPKVEQ